MSRVHLCSSAICYVVPEELRADSPRFAAAASIDILPFVLMVVTSHP